MPTYSYICNKCNAEFQLFTYIKDYIEKPKCQYCGSKKTQRDFLKDAATQNGSVKKLDSELKTIGDLANRNSERMSDDQKQDLYTKHNSYKEQLNDKPLPKGMSRMKHTKNKIKWY